MAKNQPVLLPDKRNSADSLENFAKRIEERLKQEKDKHPFAMERLICRLMSGKNPGVAAKMAEKWVEWRYGKAKERIEHSGSVSLTGIIEKARKRAD